MPVPTDPTLPFGMASVFTAGWVLIHKLERYAELIGNLLGFLFLLCTLLCAAAIAGPRLNMNRGDRVRIIERLQVSALVDLGTLQVARSLPVRSPQQTAGDGTGTVKNLASAVTAKTAMTAKIAGTALNTQRALRSGAR